MTGFVKNLLIGLILSTPVHATIHSLGNPTAPKGGSISIALPGYPKSLLTYVANEVLSGAVSNLVMETLLDMDQETYEYIPLLASSWTISPDKKIFTFKMNPKARFSDQTPVTATDVKFTWDAIQNPKHNTAPFKSIFASFESCSVLDDLTVQFKARTLHFKNLEKLGGLMILPKRFFSQGDFNKSFNTKLLGSGPYLLDEVKQGEKIILKRDPRYWGISLPQNAGKFNFDKVIFKSAEDLNVQFEVFKRGDIDYFYFLSARMWHVGTEALQFKNHYINKLKAETLVPSGFQGTAWNQRRPLFQDRRVRLALSHLMNREKWVRELMYNEYKISAGILNLNSEYHSPNVKPIPYDPKKARELLNEAGWTKLGPDGVLVKDKVRFEFDIIHDNPQALKYLTLYQEDLKTMGIKLNIRIVDWATGLKLTDDWQFDGRDLRISGDVHPSDYRQVWGSAEAGIKGSTNYTGYKNPEVDALAQKIDETFDKAVRIPLVRKLDEIIAHDQPITMAWESTNFRIAYWNKFSFPGKGYFKYSDWTSVFNYWWHDEARAAKLKKAMESKTPLFR